MPDDARSPCSPFTSDQPASSSSRYPQVNNHMLINTQTGYFGITPEYKPQHGGRAWPSDHQLWGLSDETRCLIYIYVDLYTDMSVYA